MLYSLENARDNVRNRAGQRVFYLGQGDQLTPSARDWLGQQKIRILPAEQAKPDTWQLLSGGELTKKPETMTHLRGRILVPKTHPIIAFRGAMDLLEARLLLTQLQAETRLRADLQEILDLARKLIRCDVMEEPVGDVILCGLTEQEQHKRSHFPAEYYGQPHFMPDVSCGSRILALNDCRAVARQAELAAARAFQDQDGNCTRPDILQALNRMSSMIYILMIAEKAGGDHQLPSG